MALVYNIPVSCGHPYIRQTSRCVNQPILEYKRNVENRKIQSQQSQLVRHLDIGSDCKPKWNDAIVLENETKPYKRLVYKSIHIFSHYYCISRSSLPFDEKKRALLGPANEDAP